MARYAFTSSAPSASAIRRLLELGYSPAADALLTVHPDDDMFAYGLRAITWKPLAAMAYFRAGASMMPLIQRIARWHFGLSVDG